jgi:hypothetical protein
MTKCGTAVPDLDDTSGRPASTFELVEYMNPYALGYCFEAGDLLCSFNLD